MGAACSPVFSAVPLTQHTITRAINLQDSEFEWDDTCGMLKQARAFDA